VLVGLVSSLWLPPLLLVWLGLIGWQRLRHGSWGVTLAFLSRSGRRVFVFLWLVGFAVVVAADLAQLTGRGGAGIAATTGTAVTLGLLAVFALDLVFGASIVVADAATRQSGRRRRR
jgi:hypothetical protein